MIFNEDVIKGKWLEIQGEVQKTWGKLTSDEIQQTKGDVKSIAGLVQQKYGEEQEKFQEKFSTIIAKFSDAKNNAVSDVKKGLK